jgi:aminopeptidase N
MLRSYLGDDAFFKGIQLYLTKNQFKAAEFHQLRLAFEEVCGEDLNWFFNQWYLGSAHPILDIQQKINAATNTVEITLEQSQNLELAPLFKLPMHVAIYDSLGKHIYPIVFDKINQSFTFPFSGGVNCLIVDDQQMLLAKKREDKPVNQYVFQYYNSKEYKTRFEGLVRGTEAPSKIKDKLILDALNDSFWNIRLTAIQLSDKLSDGVKKSGIDRIKLMVVNDEKSQVREAAIQFLTKNVEPEIAQLICKERIEKDSSYLVIGAGLVFLGQINPQEALIYARKLENESSSSLKLAIAQIYAGFGTISEAFFFESALKSQRLNALDEVGVLSSYSMFLVRQDVETISKAIPTYEYISKNGGYYSKMFFGQNIDYLQKHLSEILVELNAMLSVFEKDESQYEIAKMKHKIAVCEKLSADFERISQK